MSVKARAASHQQWLEDLAALKRNAKARFADVSWDDGAGNVIHAHKVIVYSRAAGSFQQRYLAPPSSMHESTLSLPGQRSFSRRSVTPTASAASHDYGGPSSSDHSHDRCTSPTSMFSTTSTAATPLSLSGTDPALFEACLDYLYTGEKGAEGVAVLFDGFGDGVREEESEVDGAVKLREDLMYSWRSKLFADVTIALDDAAETTFTAHRAILCSRSPYFQSLLLGSYGDSRLNHFTLPCPPFTSASTTFILGYIYTGTLQFSSRKFDLTTAFEIWRGAAFLSLSLLQEEVELKIEEMANVQRAARIYNFALAPDVNSQRLARAVEPWVVDKFGDVWGGPHIGNLEYDAQKKLVRDVCSKIKPESVTSIAKMTLSLRKRLELEKAMWAEHVAAMLSAIEDELVSVLSRHLSAVVHSSGFVDLVDGVGFSTDVLEWMLELIVRGLREAKAPEAYQALVGSVLLREEGILIDAKVLVEDARNGILKYVQRKWIGIRAVRGFDDLEPWCLKELSDEIEVSVEDLLADAPKLGNIAARSSLRPSLGANGTIKANPPEKKRPSLPTNLTQTSTTTTSTVTTTRTPRLSTTSNASRMTAATTASRASSVASTSRASTVAAPAVPRTNGASTAVARGASVSARGARAGASAATSARSGRPSTSSSAVPPLPNGSPSTSSPSATPSTASRAAPRTSTSSSRPLATTTRPPTLSARSSSASLRSTAPSVRPTRPSTASTSSGAAASTSMSSRPNGAASRSTATTTASTRASTTSITRRPPSLAPSLTSRPSTSSLASTASTPRPTIARPAAKPLTPATTRPRTTSSTPSVAVKAATPSVKGKEKAVSGPSAPPATRRTPSIASTKSTATLRRPPSTTSITSVRAPATATRPSSAASVKSTVRKPTTTAASLKSPTKPAKANGTPTRSINGTPTRPGARAAAGAKTKGAAAEETAATAEPKQQLPGTMLLSGIPCIVTVRSDRPTRFRAVVRYIGEVLWGEGQWVGVEVAESAIPPEARELAWNDGEVAGVSYFKIAPGSARSSGRTTPAPSEGHDLRPSAASSSNGGSIGGSGASSLRPPSRRQRRSSSSEPERDGGPRKGLFVRPNQIVYVL